MIFIRHYKNQLERGTCPYCNKSFSRIRAQELRVYLEPCGCLLYRPFRLLKLIRLNDWRAAKAAFTRIQDQNPDLRMPFKRFFEIMFQRKCEQMSKRRVA
jgi:hypothetical protein